jgi:hypothetical protein
MNCLARYLINGVDMEYFMRDTSVAKRNDNTNIQAREEAMDIHSDKEGVTITTTDEKLAQKIGREVFKSHGGELHFNWSHSGGPVRVTWSR